MVKWLRELFRLDRERCPRCAGALGMDVAAGESFCRKCGWVEGDPVEAPAAQAVES